MNYPREKIFNSVAHELYHCSVMLKENKSSLWGELPSGQGHSPVF